MFKSAIERFVLKRAVIYLLILSVIALLFFQNQRLILAGLTVGAAFSVGKFTSYAWVFGKTLCESQVALGRKPAAIGNMAAFIINQLILLPLLFLSYFFNHSFFAGFCAGILLVPLIILINSITEILGITKNHFE